MKEAELKLVRSFVALPVPGSWRAEIHTLQQQLAKQFSGVRWARTENIHLTLFFFGEQPEEALDKIAASMLSVTRLSTPFTLRCGGVGVFPNRHHPQVLWLGLEPSPALEKVQQALISAWRQAGIIARSGTFRPHLTLGRFRERRALTAEQLSEFSITPGSDWRVSQIVLYESRLQPTGAEHLPRRIALLGR